MSATIVNSISSIKCCCSPPPPPLSTATTNSETTCRMRLCPNSFSGSRNFTCRSEMNSSKKMEVLERRQVIMLPIGWVFGALLNAAPVSNPGPAAASSTSEFADMPALRGKDYGKTKMRYPDYTETESGLQYKDLRVGTGPTPKNGETVVVDWAGYTIGYYGRIFEARNKTKGGSFEGDDKDFFKFKIGSQEVVPAFEEAVSGMSLGGIRRDKTDLIMLASKSFDFVTSQVSYLHEGDIFVLTNAIYPVFLHDARIIVPPELGYPDYDFNKKGPRPTTFSGQRALSFVLRNQGLIDKTLLFDIELLKIVPN